MQIKSMLKKFTKKRIFLLCCLFLPFILGAVYTFRPTATIDTEKFQSLLREVIEENASLEILPLTDFTWDQLFIFHPYTSLDAINETLGVEWETSHKTGGIFARRKTHIDYLDDRNLLVFTKRNAYGYNEVVFYLDFLRVYGDFRTSAEAQNFSPGSVFAISKRDNLITVAPKENVWVETSCRFAKNISPLSDSQSTTCGLTTISGHSDVKLVVLDKLHDLYVLRIYGGIGDLKGDMDHQFEREYEQNIPTTAGVRDTIWVHNGVFDEAILKRYTEGIPTLATLIGFINKDTVGYTVKWKP